MPGVLMIESLAQAAAILLLDRDGEALETRASLRGVDGVKFRRQIVPGDRVRLAVRLVAERGPIARVAGQALVDDQVVAEATLVMALERDGVSIHPTANVDPAAVIGAGTTVGPNATIGPHVRLGRRCKIGASAVVDGYTELGDDNEVFPLASIGLRPQDLKYRGRADAARHRPEERVPRVRHRPSRHGRRRRRDDASAIATCSWPTPTSRTTATSATTPSSATPRRSAATSRSQSCATISAFSGGAPVLPHRPPRLHRRLLGDHQGRAAVRQDGRQPAGPQLRPEHHRPGPAPHPGRRHRQAEAGLPLPAHVEAEHDAGAGRDRARPGAGVPGSAVTSSTSSAPPRAAWCCGGR